MKDPLDPGTDDLERHTTPGFAHKPKGDWQAFRASQAQTGAARQGSGVVTPPPQIQLPLQPPNSFPIIED